MKGTCGSFLVDVAVNLTDCVFRGVDWKGRRVHADNFDDVLRRAKEQNVLKMIITGTSLVQCVKAVRLCRRYPSQLLCSVGIHPAHCAELTRPVDWVAVGTAAADDVSIQTPQPPAAAATVVLSSSEVLQHYEERVKRLQQLVEENRDVVIAIGEIGLDYAEVCYCPREMQKEFFVKQLRSFCGLHLPFIFHSRECGTDFVDILEEERSRWPSDIPFVGVVHSFNGSLEEQERLLAMDKIYFSINGSAFRKREVAEQICRIPLNRVMLETDAPWCDIRKQHFGAQFVRTQFATNVRGRQTFVATMCNERRTEPCHLRQVLEVYVGALRYFAKENNDDVLQGITEDEVLQQVYKNYITVFRL